MASQSAFFLNSGWGRRIVAGGLVAACSLATTSAQGEQRPFVDPSEPGVSSRFQEPEFWQEELSALPEYPLEENLVEFAVGAGETGLRYRIDRSQLSTDGGLVRYVLEIASPGGARNLSYEGVRCDAQEYRIYAYGVRDRFKAMPNADWRPIGANTPQHVTELQRFYLCLFKLSRPRPLDHIIRTLEGGVSGQESGPAFFE
jgi:hypothetical protein